MRNGSRVDGCTWMMTLWIYDSLSTSSLVPTPFHGFLGAGAASSTFSSAFVRAADRVGKAVGAVLDGAVLCCAR